MVLTDKQKKDLNLAIIEYLENNSYKETSLALQIEAGLDYESNPSSIKDVLEKKWVSIIRLQKKIMELELQIEQIKSEAKESVSKVGKKDSHKLFLNPKPKFTLENHRNVVTSVSLHPQYNLLASSSEDCTIKIWDYDTGQLEKTLKGHTQSVNYVQFNEKYLASASSDLTIKIWDQDYMCIRTLHGHDHSVSCVKFINQDQLISCSRDKSIKLWELQTGYCKKTLLGHDDWVRRIDYDKNSQYLASAGVDQKIMVWNLQTGTVKCELEGHDHVIEDILWLDDSGSKQAVIESSAGQSLFKFNSEQDQNTNSNIQEKYLSLVEKEKQKQEILNSLIQNQNFLVSCSRDKSIKVWSIESETCIYQLNGHDNWIRSLAIHHSLKYLYSVSDDKSIRVWDLKNMKQHRKYENAHNHFVSAIDSNIKYMMVVTASVDNSIKIWGIS